MPVGIKTKKTQKLFYYINYTIYKYDHYGCVDIKYHTSKYDSIKAKN